VEERGRTVEKGTACHAGDAAASRRLRERNGGNWDGGKEGVGRGVLAICLPRVKFITPSSQGR